jgi:hypothetical protein
MAKTVSVYNTRNSKRVFEYEEGSYTHKQAIAQNGGWRLANEEQVKTASQKKKVVESAEDETQEEPATTQAIEQLEVSDEADLKPKPKSKTAGKAKSKQEDK